MIVAEDVECPVHDEPEQLFTGADTLASCVVAGHLGANIHVTDNGSPASDPVEAEGDHIGWPLMTEVTLVEARYRCASDKRDGQHPILHILRTKRGQRR